MTRETVIADTPACRATSLMVTVAARMGLLSVPQRPARIITLPLDLRLPTLLSVPNSPHGRETPYVSEACAQIDRGSPPRHPGPRRRCRRCKRVGAERGAAGVGQARPAHDG